MGRRKIVGCSIEDPISKKREFTFCKDCDFKFGQVDGFNCLKTRKKYTGLVKYER